ncbi:MAG: gamma-glutamyltransferase, partial [Defluviicoccus sp.]
MRHSKANSLFLRQTSGFARAARQRASALVLVLLAACSANDGPREASEPLTGFIGAVGADESQAALIGRDMLAVGGSAVDAAVAIALALGVTLPSQTGIGGGGVCVAFEQKTGAVHALDFLAEAPASVASTADRPSAVPAMARGLYTLHARYGRLPWSQLVAPAERLARFGAPVSRAFARDLEAVQNTRAGENGLRRLFGTADGSRMLGEGDTIVQLELAATLSRLRSEGPAGLYTGPG